MFRRVILESWHAYVPYVCFALIAGVFAIIVIRALLMSKADVNNLASMPLRGGSRDGDDLNHSLKPNSSDTEQR